MNKAKIRDFLLLHSMLLFFSLGSVCSKLAARAALFSFEFFLFYGLVLLILLVYAAVWQQILKKFPLTTAYANKAVTIVWGMLWGGLFFGEAITWTMILGALVIIAGIYLVVSADE